MPVRSIAAALVLSVGLAAGPTGGASPAHPESRSRTAAQPPPQATFRSSVELVEVDVIALDGDGRFVPTLTAGDLELYEDGQRQKIEVFYLVDGMRADAVSKRDALTDPRSADRRFVFVFDNEHLSRESVQRLKRSLGEFLAGRFRRGDIGGIFHDGQMANGRLTSVRAELLASLRRVTPAPETRARRLALFREFPRINGEFEAARIEAGDTRTLENAAQQNCLEEPDLCRLEGGLEMVEHRLERTARQYIAEARAATSRILRSLNRIATGLSGLPGRKTVVFLSEGFFVDESRPDLRQIAAQAARNGVTIYAVDARGSAGSGRALPDASTRGGPVSSAFDTAEDGPEMLAAITGGFVVRGSDDFARAFDRIAQDTSTYYVLGYQPAAFALDGKLRRIQVRTTVEGLHLRARRGYLATALPPPR